MVKKVVGVALLGAMTIASAQMKQKGVFVGVDYTRSQIHLDYSSSGGIPINDYSQNIADGQTGYKIGYQYYFTRVYFRYNKVNFEDEMRKKFKVDSAVYELNAEYIPEFYQNKDKTWMLRGIFGGMAGYSRAKVEVQDLNLLPSNIRSDNQNRFVYGFQAGLLLESKWGVSLEGGVRYRKNNYADFDNGTDTAAISGSSREYFVGLNYLF